MADVTFCEHKRPAEGCGECVVERVWTWLNSLQLSSVVPDEPSHAEAASKALDTVMVSAKKCTFQHDKAYKHRVQVEAIASHCLRRLPEHCDVLVELGARLGHTLSLASGLPLVAIDRRSNADAFDHQEGGDRPAMRRVVADIAEEADWPQSGKVTLVAKHLCAHASDTAVEAAVRLGSRLGLLCLAPCCHAKMRWDTLSPTFQQWFKEKNFPGADAEFLMLTKMICLARAGTVEGDTAVPCSRWRLRKRLVEEAEGTGVPVQALIEATGRKACRVVDEARLAALRAAGLEVAVVEYCLPDVSPDNVLLLAAPPGSELLKGRTELDPLAAPGTSSAASAGLLLEVDPKLPSSFLQRLMSFLMEQQLPGGKLQALGRIVPVADRLSAKNPGLLAFASTPDELDSLLQQVNGCALLQRFVARLLAFRETSTSLEDLQLKASAQLREMGATVRVVGRPRALESQLVAKLEAEFLSPARFSHSLFVLEHGSDTLRWCLAPRSGFDPSRWRYGQREAGSKSYWRCLEVAARWPHLLQRSDSVAVWTDDMSRDFSWPLQWTDEFVSAETPVKLLYFSGRPPPREDGSDDEPAERSEVPFSSTVVTKPLRGSGVGKPASLLLCDIFGTGGEIEDMRHLLQQCLEDAGEGAHLAPKGTAILRLRCAKRAGPRSVKRWLRDTAKEIEQKLGSPKVELHHLLSDKEPERTAIFTWQGSVSSQKL